MFYYFLNALLTIWLIELAYPNDIFCSKKEGPWKEAMTDCLAAKGQPMSFHGITGREIETINLRPDITVWTSDFFYLDGHGREPCLCSFHYLTYNTFYEANNELFSYCDDFKYYFCRNTTSYVMEVLNNTWDYANACWSFFYGNELESALKPGYYWKNKTTKCGVSGFAMPLSWILWHAQNILCGTYSKGAGHHYRQCDTSHKHICVSSGTSFRSDLFDDSCFIAKTIETTELSKVTTKVSRSNQPQWTKQTENVTVTASSLETDPSIRVSHTPSSNLYTTDYFTPSVYTRKFSQTYTRTIQNTSKTQISNSTFRHTKGSAHQQEDPNKGPDAGSIAGIVVGVCLALAGGIVLFIFIHRRYRCLFAKNTTSNSMPKTNKGNDNQPKKSQAHILFNNIGYDTWDDNQKQNHSKQSKRNNTEISNNSMPSTNQLRTGKDKEDYYNQSNATYVNDTTETQMTASTYSFAVETENNVRDNEISMDEYDTTISTIKGVYKTENVYNKFEPVNNSSDVYDSAMSQMQSFETDDIYNKLSSNTKYGKFGITLSDNEYYDSVGNTLKNQNIQQSTDNVYN